MCFKTFKFCTNTIEQATDSFSAIHCRLVKCSVRERHQVVALSNNSASVHMTKRASLIGLRDRKDISTPLL